MFLLTSIDYHFGGHIDYLEEEGRHKLRLLLSFYIFYSKCYLTAKKKPHFVLVNFGTCGRRNFLIDKHIYHSSGLRKFPQLQSEVFK